MKENRTNTNLARMAIVAVLLLFLSSCLCVAQTAAEQITTESTRLRQLLPNLQLPPDQRTKYEIQLNLIDTATRAGSLYQGINNLQSCWLELITSEYVNSKADVEKQGVAAFENEWLRAGHELATKRKQLATKTIVPAAVQALIDAGLSQAEPLYQSARMYARPTTIDSGIFYIGRALASLDFGLFCRQLNFGKPKPALRQGPIDKEIATLESAAIKGFQDPANASLQLNFIQVNATLKMARELNAEKRYASARKKYVDALLIFGSINAPVPDAARVEALAKEAMVFRTRLLASASDQSIALMYVEIALAAKSDAELKRAAVIVEQVLPNYLKSEGGTKQ